jgi:uncharacterized SAM-binding protein YcdF (DUF218 family)
MTGQEARPRRRARARGPRLGLLSAIVVVALALLAAGFVRFADTVAETSTEPRVVEADGIVVFTGGSERIGRAVELLAAGKARRLLISGVHPETTQDVLQQKTRRSGRLFDCCIDLGREARDTRGNAAETAAWAESHRFASLIVVTSNYHMPRSLAELAHAAPQASLTPYAIASEALNLESWWRHGHTVRLLGAEYLKYLAALARLALTERGIAPAQPDPD